MHAKRELEEETDVHVIWYMVGTWRDEHWASALLFLLRVSKIDIIISASV